MSIRRAARASGRAGYELELQIDADPQHSQYWKYLYPTPDDWRVIHDMAVEDQLRKSGDDPSIERRVDHWVYFDSEAAAKPFITWALSDRFSLDPELCAFSDGKYCVRLFHVGTSHQRAVSSHTIALRQKAEHFGGNYDGWETSVEKAGGQS